jgi:hypothetical protein
LFASFLVSQVLLDLFKKLLIASVKEHVLKRVTPSLKLIFAHGWKNSRQSVRPFAWSFNK